MSTVTFTDLLPTDFDTVTLRDDVRRGLGPGSGRKMLPPRWFYDKVGSELFEEITQLPEYYPTRTEHAILVRSAGAITSAASPDTLVELGSGSSRKTTLLLDALVGPATPAPRYVALDVSEAALRGAAASLAGRYPRLGIDLVRADFSRHLDRLPGVGRRMLAFLGGTIGNFEPSARAAFLTSVRDVLDPGEHLLLGTDLVKSRDLLIPAYHDSAGVTAAFNLNVLEVLNRRLGADFDRAGFEHHAHWDAEQEWIEMRLRSRRSCTVTVRELGLTIELARGEEILTEISAKFRPGPLAAELRAAGFEPAGWWTDEQQWFAVSLWRAS